MLRGEVGCACVAQVLTPYLMHLCHAARSQGRKVASRRLQLCLWSLSFFPMGMALSKRSTGLIKAPAMLLSASHGPQQCMPSARTTLRTGLPGSRRMSRRHHRRSPAPSRSRRRALRQPSLPLMRHLFLAHGSPLDAVAPRAAPLCGGAGAVARSPGLGLDVAARVGEKSGGWGAGPRGQGSVPRGRHRTSCRVGCEGPRSRL